MKRHLLTISLIVLSSLAMIAQPSSRLLPSTQAVMNTVICNPNLVVITGRVIDASTKEPITDAKINFDKFGEELVSAAIDHEGNYALALDKREIGSTIRIIFKIEGYQRYVAKAMKINKPIQDLDLLLRPDSYAAITATTQYSLSSDAFNTLVIKF